MQQCPCRDTAGVEKITGTEFKINISKQNFEVLNQRRKLTKTILIVLAKKNINFVH